MAIVNSKDTKITIGDAVITSMEISGYEVPLHPDLEDSWAYVSSLRQMEPIEFTINFDMGNDYWMLHELLFGRPFYRYPKWVMQVVLLLSFIILILVLV